MNPHIGPLVTFTWAELLAMDQLPKDCLLAYSDQTLKQDGDVERHLDTQLECV